MSALIFRVALFFMLGWTFARITSAIRNRDREKLKIICLILGLGFMLFLLAGVCNQANLKDEQRRREADWQYFKEHYQELESQHQ